MRRTSLFLAILGVAIACGTDREDGSGAVPQTGRAGPSAGGQSVQTGGTASQLGGASSSGGAPIAMGGAGVGGTDDEEMGEGGMGGATWELPTDITFTFDPSKDDDVEVCAAEKLQASEVLLDIFLILDKSGSMDDVDGGVSCSIGEGVEGSKWCNSITALNGFFVDPGSIGIGVSYSEFAGKIEGADEGAECVAFDEMELPFAVIEADDRNGQLQLLSDELANDLPAGGTATEGAVRTLIEQTGAHIPGASRKTIAILITDGAPIFCLDPEASASERLDLELLEINGLLVDHYKDLDIPTYIVGMTGANSVQLEAMAAGAGAPLHSKHCLGDEAECSYYSVGDGDPDVFKAALESIRGIAVGCELALPQAEVGVSVLDSLEVKFTADDEAETIVLERVTDEDACTNASQYWVDTTDAEATIVKLCPKTCGLLGSSTAVELALACEGS